MAIAPVPRTLRLIELARLDVLERTRRIEIEAKRLGVRPVYDANPFSFQFGRLLGVRSLS